LKLGRKFTAGLAEGKLVFNLKRKKKKATIAETFSAATAILDFMKDQSRFVFVYLRLG
jgi:hypothetical protein